MCAGPLATFSQPRITLPRPLRQAARQSLEEHWDYLDRSFMFPEGANMILDDGGDATLYVLLGARVEEG